MAGKSFAIGFCIAIWIVSSIPTNAQVPGIQPERQQKADLAGVGYVQLLILKTCAAMFPVGMPQIQAASEALAKVLSNTNLTVDERRAVTSRAETVWSKLEITLKTNPQAYNECSGTAQVVGLQITGGMYDELKP